MVVFVCAHVCMCVCVCVCTEYRDTQPPSFVTCKYESLLRVCFTAKKKIDSV